MPFSLVERQIAIKAIFVMINYLGNQVSSLEL